MLFFKNLADWKFEGMALTPDADKMLYPDRVGERVKVVKSRKAENYVMLMHTDNMQYSDPCIGVAVSNKINGRYKFIGPLMYKGEKVRKWDMGTFIDEDGTAYLMTHEATYTASMMNVLKQRSWSPKTYLPAENLLQCVNMMVSIILCFPIKQGGIIMITTTLPLIISMGHGKTKVYLSSGKRYI